MECAPSASLTSAAENGGTGVPLLGATRRGERRSSAVELGESERAPEERLAVSSREVAR